MADLFEGCSDDEVTLKTDNSYAKRYDEWRRKEELMKAKARFGSDLEDSSSSDEEEDDEASQWTSEHEKKFLTTLSALKARDPKIYNKDEIIFPEVSTSNQKPAGKSVAPPKMTLRDYERKIMTTEGGRYVDEDEEQQRKNVFEETQQERLAYDEEQRELRESLKKAAWDAEEEAGDEEEGRVEGEVLLAKKKPKTDEEQAQDEEEYVRWLKGETKKLSNKKDAKDLATLKQLWSSEGNEKLDDAEKFLRDYVLNKRYLTATEDDCRFEVDFSEDEKDIAQMTEFEHKYNFRFEDPDPDFIKRYPRTIEDSMRRKDTRRVDKKAEKKARKEQLKVQMKEEVNRLKSFKKKEILDKIEKLKTIAGSEELDFEDADIEGDFDPDEHDKRMAALFSTYDQEDGEDNYPEIDENEHEDLRWEDWDKYEGESASEAESDGASKERRRKVSDQRVSSDESEEEGSDSNEEQADIPRAGKKNTAAKRETEEHSEDEDSNSEALGDGIERNDAGKLLIRGKKSAKLVLEDILPEKAERKRKKSRFALAISEKKPSFDPEKDKSFEKYFDEYYKLDFEDVVAGQPTRFKYRQVVPNDFGLSTQEVLQSQDKELNKWCSLKKMIQYRSKDEEDKDLQVFSKRRDHFHLKKKILTSVYTAEEEKVDEEIRVAAGRTEEVSAKKSKSRKNKKKKTLEPSVAEVETSEEIPEAANAEEAAKSPPKTKKRKPEISDSSPDIRKKKKRKQAPQDAEKTSATIAGNGAGDAGNHDENQEVCGESPQKTTGKSSVTSGAAESLPWDKLTPKQKKNRRNALIKKRKKEEQRQKRVESKKTKKLKFKPLEDLQISEARMKAYGLNPSRVKGNLVYGKRKNKEDVS